MSPSATDSYSDSTNMPSTKSTWVGAKGAAAFDLRSDTQTTPTAEMLAAIQTASLDDDVYREDQTTMALEARVAELTGKEAGLFVSSGTMGNQLGLRSLLLQPPHSVLCDARSHIYGYEAGGVSSLTGAMLTPVRPCNGLYLTLKDVKKHAIIDDDIHHCPTRVISLENTLAGLVTPLDEVRRISAFAREHGIKMHCDGARLWEAVASGAGSLLEYGECFDTMNVCFSKGLGAPIGSMLVGSHDTIKHSRWMRKAIGGGLRQAGVVSSAARVALDTTFGSGPNGEGGLLKKTHATAKRVEKMWKDMGGEMFYPCQTNMLWLELGSMNCDAGRFEELGAEHGLKVMGNRIITHYQVGEEAIKRLAAVFARIADDKKSAARNHGLKNGSSPYKWEKY